MSNLKINPVYSFSHPYKNQLKNNKISEIFLKAHVDRFLTSKITFQSSAIIWLGPAVLVVTFALSPVKPVIGCVICQIQYSGLAFSKDKVCHHIVIFYAISCAFRASSSFLWVEIWLLCCIATTCYNLTCYGYPTGVVNRFTGQTFPLPATAV